MKNFIKLINSTEENFNITIAGIEKEINTIKKLLSDDYYNENIATFTLVKSLQRSMKAFNDYLININTLFTTATVYTFSLEEENPDGISGPEMYASMLLVDMSSKNNAYCTLYDKYEEIVNDIVKSLNY